jgi:hypothetical protein
MKSKPMKTILARKWKEFWFTITLVVLLAVSGWLAQCTVRTGRPPENPSLNPSPYGYTVSLALFVFPVVVLGAWLLKTRRQHVAWKAFWRTMVILIPLGFILDIFFGLIFLKFPNPKATVGWNWPAYDWGHGFVLNSIPFEEFVFYTSGFLATLLTYVFADEVVFSLYKIEDHFRTPVWLKRKLGFYPGIFLLGVVLFLVALWIKKSSFSYETAGFPGYFLFLLCGSIIPTMICFYAAFEFVNWRAFALTYIFILVISQYWEACLGVPYQWWDYHHEQMMGWIIRPFGNLPVEAVLVWSAVTWTTIIIYETIYVMLESKKGSAALAGDEEQLRIAREKIKQRRHGGNRPPETSH